VGLAQNCGFGAELWVWCRIVGLVQNCGFGAGLWVWCRIVGLVQNTVLCQFSVFCSFGFKGNW
jgi:hypothetical protein